MPILSMPSTRNTRWYQVALALLLLAVCVLCSCGGRLPLYLFSGAWVLTFVGLCVLLFRVLKGSRTGEIHADDKYFQIFLKSDEAIFLLEDGTFVECNPQTLVLFGATMDQIIGNKPFVFSPEKQPDGQYSKEKSLGYIKAAFDGTPQTFEWVHKRMNGDCFDAEVSLKSFELNGQRLVQANVRDVTKTNQLRVQLREQKEQFEILANSSMYVTFMSLMDGSGKVIAANSATLDFFGIDQTDKNGLITHGYWLDPHDRLEYFNELDRNGAVREKEIRIKSRGEVRTLISSSTIVDYQGKRCALTIFIDITDRKRAEADLQESEQRLRAIFDMSYQFLGLLTIDGVLVEANRASLEFAGIKREEVIGKKFVDTPWWNHSAEHQRKLSQAILDVANGDVVKFETLYPDTKGKMRTVEFSLKPLMDVNGRVVMLIPEGHDITQIREDEKALRQAGVIYKLITEKAVDVIWIYNVVQERFSYISDSVEKLRGYTAQEAMAQSMQEALTANSYAKVLAQKAKWLKMPDAERIEGSMVHNLLEQPCKNGTSVMVEVISTLVCDSNNQPVEIVGISRDYTYQKQIRDRLQQEKERAQLYLDVVSVIMLACDNLGRITMLNKKGEQILGYSQEELLGRNWKDVFISANEEMTFLNEIKPLLSNALSSPLYLEYPILSKHGDSRLVAWNISTLNNGAGEVEGVLCSGEDITDRKAAERALQQSEEKYRFIVENAPIGIYKRHIDGDYEYANPTLLRDFMCRGLDELNRLYGRADKRWPSVERYHEFKERLQACHKVNDVEVKSRLENGDDRWFSINANIDVGTDLITGFAVNITDRKKAQLAAELSEQNYRRLYDSLMDAFVVINNDGYIVECNQVFESMVGYSRHELLRLTFKDITPLAWHAAEDRILEEQIMPHGYSAVYEKEYRHKDGHLFPVELRTYLMLDDQGNRLGMWAMVRDISERKQVEHNLKENEQRFRSIVTLSGHIVYEYMAHDDSIIWGGAIEQVTGFTPEEYESVTLDRWEEMIHEDDRDRVATKFKQSIAMNALFKEEYRYRNKNGDYIWIEEECLALVKVDGSVKKAIGVLKDITAQKELERKILINVIETEERERMNFSQEIHDGVGPLLSAIKMYVQWLEKPNAGLSQREILVDIQKLLDESSRTVRDISFKLSPHVLQNFGLGEAINAYVERVKVTTPMVFHIDIDTDCGILKDAAMYVKAIVYRVVCECINNTLKHAKASQIGIELKCENQMLQVTYNDDGIGFDVESVLLSPRGIGILNMQSRIKSINGTMFIASKQGEGTTIGFKVDYRPFK